MPARLCLRRVKALDIFDGGMTTQSHEICQTDSSEDTSWDEDVSPAGSLRRPQAKATVVVGCHKVDECGFSMAVGRLRLEGQVCSRSHSNLESLVGIVEVRGRSVLLGGVRLTV